MANFFIIHEAFSDPQENWIPWIKARLEAEGSKVFAPSFPTPEGQNLKNWLKVFEKLETEFKEDSILIGHGIGCAFILNLLEKSQKQVNAAFLVSGFTGSLGIEELDEINATIADELFNWKRIRKNCRRFIAFHSDNDGIVPLDKGKSIAERLGAKFILVEHAGHFNENSGFTKFELLLEEIKRL